jgi:uncharacterized protein YgiM (DUF1202 family)
MWRKIAWLLVALTLLGAVPVLAQNSLWYGEFYNNIYLLGRPVVTRQDSQIAFDWSLGSPDSRVNADNFSVRWAADPTFVAGAYRFYAMADDSVCIWVDFQKVLDTFDQARVGQVVSADLTLRAGSHHIQVDYRENTGASYVYMTWNNLATHPGGPNFPTPPQIPTPANTGGGYWTAQYYNNPALSGAPVLIQAESWPLARNWGAGSPGAGIPSDYFSARWTGSPMLADGHYRASVRADDGVRVWIDGKLVIDEFHNATNTTYTADVALGGGLHNLMVEYYEAGGVAFIDFSLLQVSGGVSIGGSWTGSYYNNAALAGAPTVTLMESSPTHNWGISPPVAGLPADYFSARWTSTQYVDAGAYRMSLFADDGARLYVDNRIVIDEFHGATGIPYSADMVLPAGQHVFVIEYYEAAGSAFLTYNFVQVSSGVTPSSMSAGSVRVKADLLNLRQSPNCECSVLAKIGRGETYPLVGSNADRSWWQVNVNGTIGWVYAGFVEVLNALNVPVTDQSSTPQPAATGHTITALVVTIIRSGPGNRFAFLGQMPVDAVAHVVGRNANNTWWQVNHNGTVGWVRATSVRIQPDTTVNRIPIR